MKLLYMCLMHSLFSACGKTASIAFSNPLQASEHKTSPGGSPMTVCKFSRNHVQLSSFSVSKTPYAIWYIQLCPSTPVAAANCPVRHWRRTSATTSRAGGRRSHHGASIPSSAAGLAAGEGGRPLGGRTAPGAGRTGMRAEKDISGSGKAATQDGGDVGSGGASCSRRTGARAPWRRRLLSLTCGADRG